MSSFFDESSLCLIPSGYKTSKLYSVKPIPEYGPELVTNGDFATDSDWTKAPSGVTISGGSANFNLASDTYVYQDILTATKTYKIIFSGTINSGSIYIGENTVATNTYTAGTYTNEVAYFTVSSSSRFIIRRTGVGALDATIDNVSVKEVLVSGDLDFTRSNDTATRVNSSGLIEKVRTNLVLYSQAGTNAAWVKDVGVTVTDGQQDANGGTNGMRIQYSSSSLEFRQAISGLSRIYTMSVYIKGTSGQTINLYNGFSNNFKTMDGTWQRFTVTSTPAGATSYSINTYGATATDILISFPQLEEGSVATEPITTLASPVSVGPVANVPRLDYSGGATCPSLLLEPQRLNGIVQSEYFGGWVKNGIVVEQNQIVSPDGNLNGTKYQGDGTNSPKMLYANGGSVTSGTAYTWSVFVKKGTLNYCQLILGSANFDNALFSNFDLLNGTIGSNGGGATPFIESYGNDWYRVGITATADANGAGTPFVILANSATMPRVNGITTSGYVYIYGAQFEAGSYPTSYIPTYGAAVTRGADACVKSGISSILPSQTGTIYAEFDFQKTREGVQIISVHNNSTGLAWIIKNDNTTIGATYFSSGFIGSLDLNVGTNAGILKVAYAWTNGSQSLYVNGVQAGTATGAITDTEIFSFFEVNGFWQITKEGTALSSALIFKTRLTNAQLAELTTL